jgi:hypothetical protein
MGFRCNERRLASVNLNIDCLFAKSLVRGMGLIVHVGRYR